MAKARKGKSEEQRGDNSEAVVRHQKLCLTIDMDKRRICGYTELDVVVPENGILGLHADNLVIDSVTVDGEPTEFEVFPHYLALENGDRWCSVSSTTSAADAAGSVYLSHRDRELLSNLLIMCKKPVKHDIERQEMHLENGVNSSAENNQTTDTRIKFAYALARQWFGVLYITPEAPNDVWLLDGLAGFLTDMFIKRFLGNSEARYRRYKETDWAGLTHLVLHFIKRTVDVNIGLPNFGSSS